MVCNIWLVLLHPVRCSFDFPKTHDRSNFDIETLHYKSQFTLAGTTTLKHTVITLAISTHTVHTNQEQNTLTLWSSFQHTDPDHLINLCQGPCLGLPKNTPVCVK